MGYENINGILKRKRVRTIKHNKTKATIRQKHSKTTTTKPTEKYTRTLFNVHALVSIGNNPPKKHTKQKDKKTKQKKRESHLLRRKYTFRNSMRAPSAVSREDASATCNTVLPPERCHR